MRSETKKENKMKKLRELINNIGFEYEREDKAVKAIEIIFNLVASRDFRGIKKLSQTKLGSAFLDIAEEYGANTSCNRAEWHFYKDSNGKIVEYSKEFKADNKLDDLGFKKEVISEGITCFTLDSKNFR